MDDAASADSADAQTLSDSASADPAPDAADPTVLDSGDTPTPPPSEIASAAGLTGAGQTESTPAGTLATDLVEGKELAEQQKQEETAEAEATWNEDLGLWMTSKGATGVKDEYDDGYVAGEQTPRSTTSRLIASPTKFLSSMATRALPRWRCPRPSTTKNVVSLTGMGSAALTSITFAPNSHVRSVEAWAAAASKRSHCPIRSRSSRAMHSTKARRSKR